MKVYNAVQTPGFWKTALMIVTYDEHGGFFDYVAPPRIVTDPPDDAKYSARFETLGVRVPAYIISPFVQPGTVSHNLLDHTSILKLLGEKFGNGVYSPEVDARPVGSVSHLLVFDNPQPDPPAPLPLDEYLAKRAPAPDGVVAPTPNTELQKGFRDALDNMKQHGADASHPKFGQLLK